MDEVKNTLEERGKKYGEFNSHAYLTQSLKVVMGNNYNWNNRLTNSMREALEMIAHKIGRILNGDPFYADSWIDIAGYATLVAKELEADDVDKHSFDSLEEVIHAILDEMKNGRKT